MKFELIDQVEDISDDRIVAVKAVTAAEEYLGDHFPGFPILPGVLMLEVMVQAGQRLAQRRGDADTAWVVRDVRNVRYGGMVRPGQVLRVDVKLRSQDDTGIDLQGTGTVDGETAVQGRFRLEPLGVPAGNPV
ncbi:MAG: beta-hydroxyacyl-ACP dehydratase [Planctomycetota bacterium]